MPCWDSYYAARAERIQPTEIRELLRVLDQPEIISFAGGVPDPRLFPVEAISEACCAILSDPCRSKYALQYAFGQGYLPLRTWLAGYMGTRDLPCAPDNILITCGSQQALDLIGKLFISPGDTVLIGWPTYLGALEAFNVYEPHYDVLPQPGSNRTPESYKCCGKPKPKFGYVMPEFQNPTGISLTRDERLNLLDIADAMDTFLVEDLAYEHLRYSGACAPPLVSLAAERAGGIDNAKVLYCGTFSKSIVPALRVGWITGPVDVIKKLALVSQAAHLHVPPLNQMILYEIASKMMKPHAEKIRGIYRERRDAMLDAFARHMPKTVSWTKPEGGMFIWTTLPEHIDTTALFRRAVDEQKIAFVPGVAFYPDRSGRNKARFSYALHEPDVIDEGICRFGELMRAA